MIWTETWTMEEQHMEMKAELVTSSNSSRTPEARETSGTESLQDSSGRSYSSSALMPNFRLQ